MYRESDADWLNAMVTVRPPAGTTLSWVSAFSALVRDARRATGRNLETGLVDRDEDTGSWLGALGYLVLLDQIGECFEVPTERRRPPRGNDFLCCLANFSPQLTHQDMLALYALRNAFAHSYSLTHTHPKEQRLRHRFLLTSDSSALLITYPKVLWSGIHADQRHDNQTQINLRALGDLAERIVPDVQAQVKAGTATVKLRGGLNELRNRFSISLMGGVPSNG